MRSTPPLPLRTHRKQPRSPPLRLWFGLGFSHAGAYTLTKADLDDAYKDKRIPDTFVVHIISEPYLETGDDDGFRLRPADPPPVLPPPTATDDLDGGQGERFT